MMLPLLTPLLSGSLLPKLALAVLLLSAGAGGGWWAKGKVDAPIITSLEAQVAHERTVAQLLESNHNRTRASIAAIQGQAQECLDREARYSQLQTKADVALTKARQARTATSMHDANATAGAGELHGDLIRILNEAAAGRWDE